MPYEAVDGTNPYAGILPGKPAPYFLEAGEGEKSIVFDTTFNILLSGDETEGQFGALSRSPRTITRTRTKSSTFWTVPCACGWMTRPDSRRIAC
jgi:hypothetical protein